MQAFDNKFETNRLLHAAGLPVARSFVLSDTTRANVCALADVAEACRSRDMSFPLIEEMRAMLGDVLRFTQDERHAGHVTVDLGSVLDALVDDLASAGVPVTIDDGPRVLVRGDPAGLRRLFANAVRYGHAAHVDWQLGKDAVTVRIDDHGPGFDPALGDWLFEPFVRGDSSRNRATGGTGLGLAIVRSLTEAHGGRITLRHGEHGGRVEVMLPHV